jgi:diacylglycerol kinase
VPITGAVADALSIEAAMRLQTLVILLAIPLALLLPSEAALRRMREGRG